MLELAAQIRALPGHRLQADDCFWRGLGRLGQQPAHGPRDSVQPRLLAAGHVGAGVERHQPNAQRRRPLHLFLERLV